MTIGIISGYFAPLHEGHIRYMYAAREHCDHLVAIVNNDNQLMRKKGYIPISEDARATIVAAIRFVDEVQISLDTGPTVVNTLTHLRKSYYDAERIIFFNDGDATSAPEERTVEGIEHVYLGHEKVNSSTSILTRSKE